MDIQKVKQDRFIFLHKLYEMVNGNSSYEVDIKKVGNELCYSFDYTSSIYEYLSNEGLLTDGECVAGTISITHIGVKEIEESMSLPNKPTQHFPPFNQYNINIGIMHGGAIQQGTDNSTISYVDKNKE